LPVGLHDPCPCGSGERAGECCIARACPVRELGVTSYPERFAIGLLLSECELFARFYERERERITCDILWAEDTGLPIGIAARATCTSAGTSVIRLRQMPAEAAHAQLVAHELGHFLVDLEGFPSLAARPGLDCIAAPLNSMLHDPLVDRLLRSHGFDLRAGYDAEVAEAREALGSKPNPPESGADQLLWILNYVAKRLDWDVVRGDNDSERDAFRPYFRERYPDLAKTGDEVYTLIQSIGFDTPGKMSSLLRVLMQSFDLGDGFAIRIPEGGLLAG